MTRAAHCWVSGGVLVLCGLYALTACNPTTNQSTAAAQPTVYAPVEGCADQGALAVYWSLRTNPQQWGQDSGGFRLKGPVSLWTANGASGLAVVADGDMLGGGGLEGVDFPEPCKPVVWRGVQGWFSWYAVQRVREAG